MLSFHYKLQTQIFENDPIPAQCQKTFSSRLIRRVRIILGKNVACYNQIQVTIQIFLATTLVN